jgi:AcrR family transcriptional regulator
VKKPLRFQNSEPAAVATDVRILEIAADHIRRNGIEHLTILQIAAEAGMSHANVYRYYPSKMALIEEITAQWLKPLEAGLHIIGDAPDPAFDKLERLIFALHRAYRKKCENDPSIFALFAGASARGANVVRRHYGRRDAEMRRIIEEIESINPKRALNLILDSAFRFIDPVTMKADIEANGLDLEQRLDLLTKTVFRALRAGEIESRVTDFKK